VVFAINEHEDKKANRTKFDLVGLKDKVSFQCDNEKNMIVRLSLFCVAFRALTFQ